MSNPLHALKAFAPEYQPALGDMVPDHLRGGLARYLLDGIRPGSFMSHCIENDLMHAAVSAGAVVTVGDIRAICLLLHSCAPAWAIGSPKAIDAWTAAGGFNGIKRRETFDPTDPCSRMYENEIIE